MNSSTLIPSIGTALPCAPAAAPHTAAPHAVAHATTPAWLVEMPAGRGGRTGADLFRVRPFGAGVADAGDASRPADAGVALAAAYRQISKHKSTRASVPGRRGGT